MPHGVLSLCVPLHSHRPETNYLSVDGSGLAPVNSFSEIYIYHLLSSLETLTPAVGQLFLFNPQNTKGFITPVELSISPP